MRGVVTIDVLAAEARIIARGVIGRSLDASRSNVSYADKYVMKGKRTCPLCELLLVGICIIPEDKHEFSSGS